MLLIRPMPTLLVNLICLIGSKAEGCAPPHPPPPACWFQSHMDRVCILEDVTEQQMGHLGRSECPLRLLPQPPAWEGQGHPHSKCLRNTLSMQEMGQFFSNDFILKTKFKLSYSSLLLGECCSTNVQDCQTLCFRILLPSCTQQPVIQLKTELLSPVLASETKARTPAWFST